MPLPQPGDLGQYDYQSDIFGRRYKVLEVDSRTGNATIELLSVEDDALEAMIADKYMSDESILREIASTGEMRKIRFVSSAAWHAMF